MPHVSTRQAFPWLQNARLPHLAFLFLLAAIVLPRESFASERFEPRPPENLEQCIQWLGSIEPEPHDCREIDNVAICVWPTQLSLDVRESGAAFTMEVSVFAPVDVVLPGSEDAWPQDVKLDRKSPALLRAEEGVPTVTLTQGQHTLTGFIPWSEIPDNLAIPGATGLLRLRINGKTIPFPARIESELSLVTDLEQDEEEEDLAVDALAPDSEKLEVSRALLDGVPMRVKTRVLLHITGKEREWVLPNPLLVGTKLIEVKSSVPVTFRDDGSLVMSVRPGTLRIDLEGYLPSSPTSLVPPKHPAPWPTQEVWIWRAATGGAPSIGQVSLSGAPAVELSRTHAPSEWAGGATYLVGRNDALNFEVLQRGVSQSGSNHLTLHRNMRADYAGTGWTVVDQINGEMHLAKRLDLTADNGELGSVVLGEKAQVVTIGSEEHHGVDLHSHNLSMRATWRIQEATSTLPLGAWSEEFDGVNLDFMLPQGWDLLHAQGPGNVAPTWIGTWTSLAFLGLLAVVVLVVRVVGPLAGAAALLDLAQQVEDLQAEKKYLVSLLITAVDCLEGRLAGFHLLEFLNLVKLGST